MKSPSLKYTIIYCFLLIEGASLLAVELIGAKQLAPYYGVSIYVWTAVLCITLAGLALGYLLGAKLANGESLVMKLTASMFANSLWLILIGINVELLLGKLISLPFFIGLFTATFLLTFIPLLCFGIVGPVMVSLLNTINPNKEKNAANIYVVSTIGGVFGAFLFGFYFIPFHGLIQSLFIIAALLVLVSALLFLFIPQNS